MISNQNNINKKNQLYQQQRTRLRRNERSNYSPNINKINNIKNQNYNIRNQNISKNNNIYYINPISNLNQVNSSQNIAAFKYLKSKQPNQIYLEGDLNYFVKNKTNIYQNNSNIKNKNNSINNNINNMNNILEKQKNHYINHIPNNNKSKNNRGIVGKSPIPVPKGFNANKYINNDNMSYMSKNSNNSNNTSHYTANSQLINNNFSISNLSQISGYSNNSYNNHINIGSIIDNNHQIRAYSNNVHSSTAQKKYNNGNINFNNQANKNLLKNKSANNILNRQNNIKINNYINNNKINNINNLINNILIKKGKVLSKSPNPQKKDYLSYTIKRNMNNNYKNNQNNNIFNNSNISNASNLSNISNETLFSKIGYRTTSNFAMPDNNINLYENYNDIQLNANNNNTNKRRPTTSFKRKNDNMNINDNGYQKYDNMLMLHNDLNSNEINFNNYNSNEAMHRHKISLNNKNNINNNYIQEYNTQNGKRNYSANISNKRNNNEKINNNYLNNVNNINHKPMVNLHIINKGQIINNNYNNVNNNNINNNMNDLYVYKYDISQNNIIQGKYNTNTNKNNSKNIIKNSIRNNNNNNMKKTNGFTHDGININYNNLYNNINNLENINNINNERQNNHKVYKKGVKIRSNSSSGVGVTGKLNNILNQRNSKANQNLINAKKIDPTKINHNYHKNSISSNKSMNGSTIKSPTKKHIIKQIRKIHHFTHVGFNGERDKDFNQDIAFLEKNFAGNNSYLYLAVCDGHGTEGHEVSGFIKRILPKELSNSLYQKNLLTNDINSKKKIYNIIGQTFIKVNDQLISNEAINSIFSGTTCVSIIYTPLKLICANIGDSRAVLGRFDKNLKKWIAINLSRDHKPTEEDEARRIYKKGGRIKPYVDEETGEEVGPQRVWVKDDDVPGLAMTRSFGDRVASIAGTICIPEIKEYYFNDGDKFLILASDGVWEFIQSEECINIIGKFYLNNNIEGCCKYLYIESKKRWIKEEEVIDDITMLLAFFD